MQGTDKNTVKTRSGKGGKEAYLRDRRRIKIKATNDLANSEISFSKNAGTMISAKRAISPRVSTPKKLRGHWIENGSRPYVAVCSAEAITIYPCSMVFGHK